MQSLSVVVICKNEAGIISNMLTSLEGLTDDIILYDTGSTDATLEIARRFPVKIYEGPWEGFGKTKQKSTSLARYDWILSIDADESLDEKLKQSLLELQLSQEKTVYRIRRKNFLGNRHVRFGEWGSDSQNRLFNRREVQWDDAEVHEKLILPPGGKTQNLKGFLLHKTMINMADYSEKTVRYALLCAEKYFRTGRRTNRLMIRLAPAFAFMNFYFFRLGFLDGYTGYVCAKMTAHYTFLKYARLRDLEQQNELP